MMDRREKTALHSVLANVGLVLLKIVAATISGSLALLADAWHSGSDIIVSLLVMAGLRISKKGRRIAIIVENSIAILISLFIFWAVYEIFRRALGVSMPQIRFIPLVMVITAACIMVLYFLSRYKIHVGRETESPSLTADGYHSRMDMYSSIVVLIGLTGQMIGLPMDKFAAIVVVMLIAMTGIEILTGAVQGLVKSNVLNLNLLYGLWSRLPSSRIKVLMESAVRFIDLKFASIWRKSCSAVAYRRRGIFFTIIMLSITIYFSKGFYTVYPGEIGVLQKFGRKIADNIAPGLHFHWPSPIEKVTKIRINETRRVEIGFRTKVELWEEEIVEPSAYLWEIQHLTGKYEKRIDEALMLTGDENIIDLNIVVHYRIKNPSSYLFHITGSNELVRNVVESIARQSVGIRTLGSILSTSRDEVQQEIKERAQDILDQYCSGITTDSVWIQDVHPPVEVVPSFRDVATAREEKVMYINEAIGYRNEIVPMARGEAERSCINAAAYKKDKINRATGESCRFLKQLGEYEPAKKITEKRLYLETVEEALASTEKFIIDAKIKSKPFDYKQMFMFGKLLYSTKELDFYYPDE